MGLLDFIFGDRMSRTPEKKQEIVMEIMKRVEESKAKLGQARASGDRLGIDRAERTLGYWEKLLERLEQDKTWGERR
ncbi:MAG: hypothetical protein V1827_01610 [Candidatus Micrarchaeota archaeon]